MAAKPEFIYVYLLENIEENAQTKTCVGCVEDVYARVDQHNGVLPNGPRSTKKGRGNWRLAMILQMPHSRTDISSTEIKKKWRTRRGIVNRLEEGVNLSKEYKLPLYYSTYLVPKYPVVAKLFKDYANASNILLRSSVKENLNNQDQKSSTSKQNNNAPKRKINVDYRKRLEKLSARDSMEQSASS